MSTSAVDEHSGMAGGGAEGAGELSTVVAGVDLGDSELASTVRNGLEQVEKLLIDELSDGEDFLQEAALHLAKAGGKRFRPLFTILTGQLGPNPTDPALITAGTVVELVHLATLYHDDVMDEAPMRRGAVSVNSRWGNSIAILAGDYLFAHASRLTSTLGPDAVRIIAETFAELVTGQMRETMGAREAQDPIEHYLRVVWEKTGSLIAASGRFGGTFSGADTDHVERLARLGDAVGTAFQISDDIIDISSAAEQSGKTPGTDLREGVHTLPVLYALREEGAEGDRLRAMLTHPDPSALTHPVGSASDHPPVLTHPVGSASDHPPVLARPLETDAEVEEALALLGRSRGMVLAKEKLQGYADIAYAELSALPAGPANDALERLVRYTIERVG